MRTCRLMSLLVECCVFQMTRQVKNSSVSLMHPISCYECVTWRSKLDPLLRWRRLPLRMHADAPESSHFLTSLHFRLCSHSRSSFVWTASLCAWHACLAFLTSLSCDIGMISIPVRTLPETVQHSSVSSSVTLCCLLFHRCRHISIKAHF